MPPPSLLLPDWLSSRFAITYKVWAVSSQHAPLWGKGEPSTHRESVFAILHSGTCPPTQNSLLMFGPQTFRNYYGQEEGVDFFFSSVNNSVTLDLAGYLLQSSELEGLGNVAGREQLWRTWVSRVGPNSVFPTHCCWLLLTGTSFQTFLSLFILSYEMRILMIKVQDSKCFHEVLCDLYLA